MGDRTRSILLLKVADDRYRSALEAKHSEEDGRPVLSVHFADVLTFEYVNGDRLKQILLSLDEFSGLLLTSPRSAIAVTQTVQSLASEQASDVIEKLRKLPVFSVGAATSRELEPLGIACRGEESGSAELLAQYLHGTDGALPPDCETKPIVFLCGEKRSDVLPGSFHTRGLPLQELVVYRTCPVQELHIPKECGKLDWVVFFSPSGMKVARELGLPWATIKKAAIGMRRWGAAGKQIGTTILNAHANAQERQRRPQCSNSRTTRVSHSGLQPSSRQSPHQTRLPPQYSLTTNGSGCNSDNLLTLSSLFAWWPSQRGAREIV